MVMVSLHVCSSARWDRTLRHCTVTKHQNQTIKRSGTRQSSFEQPKPKPNLSIKAVKCFQGSYNIMDYEMLFYILLILPVALVCVYLLFKTSTYTPVLVAKWRAHRAGLPGLPGGSMGWPVLGESGSFATSWSHPNDPLDWYSERKSKYGDIFKTHLIGDPVVVMLGAEANKFILTNDNKLFINGWPFSTTHLIGEEALVSSQFEHHKLNHRAVMSFIGPKALSLQFHRIQQAVCDCVGRWRNGEVVDAYYDMKKMMVMFLCEYFYGFKEGSFVLHEFQKTAQQYTAGMFSYPLDLPWTTFGKSMKARRKIVSLVYAEIEKRRPGIRMKLDEEVDESFLDAMVRGQEKGVEGCLNNVEIASNMFGLLLGSMDTTVSALTTLVRHLAVSPHIVHRLRQECKSARSQREDGMLEWEDLKGMDYMKMVIMEALRIESPVIGGFKLARESIVYKGVTIPKGWKVHYCIRSMHLDEQYFKNPKEFIPERFEKGREEAYSFVPFGQGPRMCPGKDLAKTVMGLMAYHLVMNHDFSLYHFKEGSIKSFFSIQPLHGLPLLLKPCKSSSM